MIVWDSYSGNEFCTTFCFAFTLGLLALSLIYKKRCHTLKYNLTYYNLVFTQDCRFKKQKSRRLWGSLLHRYSFLQNSTEGCLTSSIAIRWIFSSAHSSKVKFWIFLIHLAIVSFVLPSLTEFISQNIGIRIAEFG